MKTTKHYIFIFLCLTVWLSAQTYTPETIFMNVAGQYDKINDYEIQARLSLNIPNLRMPEKKIWFYYKKPDKYMTYTNGFAMVPKKGVLPNAAMINPDSVRLSLESVSDAGLVLLAQPATGDSALIARILVNPKRWTIESIKAGSQTDFETDIHFYYTRIDGFWVPDSTIINLKFGKGLPDVSRPSLHNPFGKFDFSGTFDAENRTGWVKVVFEKYKINKGLKDSVFNEN